jgi:hypothetical protein
VYGLTDHPRQLGWLDAMKNWATEVAAQSQPIRTNELPDAVHLDH